MLNRSYLVLLLVGSAVCASLSTAQASGVWAPEAELNASDGAATDYFGSALALDATTVVVGAYADDLPSKIDAGSAYVYGFSEGVWTQQAKLVASDGQSNDTFGFSVAIWGDTVCVGARGDDTGSVKDVGSIYFFTQSGTNWTEQSHLFASDAAADDMLGVSVSIWSNQAVVGSYLDDTAVGVNAGSVYVFTRTGTVWSQTAKITPNDAIAGARFGSAVSIASNTLLVGASYDNVPGSIEQGSGYVFVWDGTNWIQQAKLVAPDAGWQDRFGSTVSLSGDTALLGALQHDKPSADEGAAYVFTRSGTNWTYQAELGASDAAVSDFFGTSVAVWEDWALIGAYRDDLLSSPDQGSAYLFKRNGINWTEQNKFMGSDSISNDYFGIRVALGSSRGVIGAHGHNTLGGADAGAVYVLKSKATNAPPVALDDIMQTDEDTALVVNVLTNDLDPDGDPLTIVSVIQPTNGTVVVDAAATHLTYTPALNYHGTDLFYYVIDDGWVGRDTGTVRVAVSAVNDPPAASNDLAWTPTNRPVSLSVLQNDGDVDGDLLTNITFVTQPAHGVAAIGGPGDSQALYTPADGFIGEDTFTYGVSDGQGGTGTADVRVIVYELNNTPSLRLMAGDAYQNLSFGRAVSLWGTNLAIGANFDDGAVYVFSGRGSNWTQRAKLSALDAQNVDNNGGDVGLFETTIMSGANGEDQVATDAGAAYVFVQDTVWTQQTKRVATDGAAWDHFGWSVSVYSNTAIVGAKDHDVSLDEGAAYVFVRTGTNWAFQAKLMAPDPVANDYFGYDVSVYGETALIGAPGQGIRDYAYIFVRQGTNWTLQARLTNATEVLGDFGCSVSLGDGICLVGDRLQDVRGVTNAGAAIFCVREGTHWNRQALLTALDPEQNDGLGRKVALYRDLAVLGAEGVDVGGCSNAGAAYVFQQTGTNWTQRQKLVAPGATNEDQFGSAVSIWGATVAVGAAQGDHGSTNGCGWVCIYNVALDSDGDGLENLEEESLGTDSYEADTDRDGMGDGDEYLTGSDPRIFTPLSQLFRVGATAPVADAAGLIITWPGHTGRLYAVQSNTNFPGTWENTDYTNIPGMEGTMSYTGSMVRSAGFYRVQAQRAP